MRSTLPRFAATVFSGPVLRASAALLVVGLAVTSWTLGAAEQSDERTGAVEAVVVDGDATDDVRPGAATVSRRTARSTADSDPLLRGSMVGSYIVSIYSEDGYWVDIGRGGDVHVPLQRTWGHTQITVADDVPAGTYTRVRITMCHSGARLDPGSRIGSLGVDAPRGLKLTETGDVFIRRDVEPFTVEKHRLVRVELDLNAERWITAETVETGEIDVPTFERAVGVSILSSPE